MRDVSKRATAMIALLVIGCAWLGGCSSKRHVHVWNERYVVAARAHDQGDIEGARGHYAELLEHAPDEESARLVRYRLALLLEEQGQEQEALAAYAEIYEAEQSSEYAARALYRAARIIAEREGEQAALPMYHELLAKHGDWVVAEHAVALLGAYYAERSVQVALDELLTHREDVRGKSVEGDYLMYIASLYRDLGQREQAIASYAQVLAAEHLQVLWDDALWEQAEIEREARDWRSALVTLERLATEFQETSYFIGDYTSEHADQARFEMGRIYLEELGEPGEAVAQFDRFLKDFETNRLRDDAAWMRLKALERAGDTRRYQRELKRFSKDFPESRYVRRLAEGEAP